MVGRKVGLALFAITVTDIGDYETPFETPFGTDLDPGPEGLHGFGVASGLVGKVVQVKSITLQEELCR